VSRLLDGAQRMVDGAQRVLDTVVELVEHHTLDLGPLRFTPQRQVAEREISAFDLGREIGPKPGPPPAPRRLHPV